MWPSEWRTSKLPSGLLGEAPPRKVRCCGEGEARDRKHPVLTNLNSTYVASEKCFCSPGAWSPSRCRGRTGGERRYGDNWHILSSALNKEEPPYGILLCALVPTLSLRPVAAQRGPPGGVLTLLTCSKTGSFECALSPASPLPLTSGPFQQHEMCSSLLGLFVDELLAIHNLFWNEYIHLGMYPLLRLLIKAGFDVAQIYPSSSDPPSKPNTQVFSYFPVSSAEGGAGHEPRPDL